MGDSPANSASDRVYLEPFVYGSFASGYGTGYHLAGLAEKLSQDAERDQAALIKVLHQIGQEGGVGKVFFGGFATRPGETRGWWVWFRVESRIDSAGRPGIFVAGLVARLKATVRQSGGLVPWCLDPERLPYPVYDPVLDSGSLKGPLAMPPVAVELDALSWPDTAQRDWSRANLGRLVAAAYRASRTAEETFECRSALELLPWMPWIHLLNPPRLRTTLSWYLGLGDRPKWTAKILGRAPDAGELGIGSDLLTVRERDEKEFGAIRDHVKRRFEGGMLRASDLAGARHDGNDVREFWAYLIQQEHWLVMADQSLDELWRDSSVESLAGFLRFIIEEPKIRDPAETLAAGRHYPDKLADVWRGCGAEDKLRTLCEKEASRISAEPAWWLDQVSDYPSLSSLARLALDRGEPSEAWSTVGLRQSNRGLIDDLRWWRSRLIKHAIATVFEQGNEWVVNHAPPLGPNECERLRRFAFKDDGESLLSLMENRQFVAVLTPDMIQDLPLGKLDSVAGLVVAAKKDEPKIEPDWVSKLYLSCREKRAGPAIQAAAADWLASHLDRFPAEHLADLASRLLDYSSPEDAKRYKHLIQRNAKKLDGRQVRAINQGWKGAIPSGKEVRARRRTSGGGLLRGQDPVWIGIIGTFVFIVILVGAFVAIRMINRDGPVEPDDPGRRTGPTISGPEVVRNSLALDELERWQQTYPEQ